MNAALILIVLLLLGFSLLFFFFEKSKIDEKTIAIIATLGALAAVGRILFAALPNVKPTTFLVMASGYVFGMRAGFFVGVLAALFSNFYLGQGPWTLWQMIAWGLSGVFAALLSRIMEKNDSEKPMLSSRKKLWIFIGSCTAWGFFYGWIMNLWHFLAYGSYMSWGGFLAVYAASFSFDLAHALGNFAFSSLFATITVKTLQRYHRKLIVSRWAPKEESS